MVDLLNEFVSALDFSISVTGPIFVIIALGAWLKKIGLINEAFVEVGSRLVFVVTLPTLLFISVSKTNLDSSVDLSVCLFGLLSTLIFWLMSEALAKFVVREQRDRGVVVQGVFRSNLGIIGLAYCFNAYGNPGLVAASLYAGLVTILYNVLSVITLNSSINGHQNYRRILKAISLNPLIIGILLALPVSMFGIQLPKVLIQSGEYFANMTLPLALLCTGASLNFMTLRTDPRDTLLASVGKLIFVPLLSIIVALALGFKGVELGVIFLMAASPSAASGYAMVRAMGGNAALAANIVALTTIGSLLFTSAGIAVLKGFGYM